jgi:hypothetical protein
LVLSYTVGRPEATVNPDDLDLQEYQQFDRESKAAVAAVKIVTSPQIGVMNEIIRASRPLMNDTVVNGLQRGLARLAEEDRAEQAEDEAYPRELQQEQAARTQGTKEESEAVSAPGQVEGTCESPGAAAHPERPEQGKGKGETSTESTTPPSAQPVERGRPRVGTPHATRRKRENRVAPVAQDGEVEEGSSPLHNGDNRAATAGRAPRGRSGQEAGGYTTPP